MRKRRILLSRITIVEIGDSYNNHLAKLKKVGEKIRAGKNEYLYNRGEAFLNKLVSLVEKKSVCTFFFDTEYVFGVALRLQDNFLVIKAVSYRGSEEGEIYCNSDAITKVRYNGPLEEKIKYLLKYNGVRY